MFLWNKSASLTPFIDKKKDIISEKWPGVIYPVHKSFYRGLFVCFWFGLFFDQEVNYQGRKEQTM